MGRPAIENWGFMGTPHNRRGALAGFLLAIQAGTRAAGSPHRQRGGYSWGIFEIECEAPASQFVCELDLSGLPICVKHGELVDIARTVFSQEVVA